MDAAEVDRALRAGGGVLTRRGGLSPAALDWEVRTGRLVPVLPGVYTAPQLVRHPQVRLRAVAAAHVDAVLVGGAAARLTFLPSAPMDVVEAAVQCGLRPQPGYRWQRRRVPVEHVLERDGLRFTDPALTAVELAAASEGEAIDLALRTRTATLAGMAAALQATRGRAGNQARARLLLDSRDEPWSAAERPGAARLAGAPVHLGDAARPPRRDGGGGAGRPENADAVARLTRSRASLPKLRLHFQGALTSSAGAMSTETFIVECLDSVKITPFTGSTSP